MTIYSNQQSRYCPKLIATLEFCHPFIKPLNPVFWSTLRSNFYFIISNIRRYRNVCKVMCLTRRWLRKGNQNRSRKQELTLDPFWGWKQAVRRWKTKKPQDMINAVFVWVNSFNRKPLSCRGVHCKINPTSQIHTLNMHGLMITKL